MQFIKHTELWVLVSIGSLYCLLLAIFISSIWDLISGARKDKRRQDIFFGRYNDIIVFAISAGPLIGLFSTNRLGSEALEKAAPILSGSANGTAQMGEMFSSIAGAMSATSLGIGLALTAFAVELVCRWIYSVEPRALELEEEKPERKAEVIKRAQVVADKEPITVKTTKPNFPEYVHEHRVAVVEKGSGGGNGNGGGNGSGHLYTPVKPEAKEQEGGYITIFQQLRTKTENDASNKLK